MDDRGEGGKAPVPAGMALMAKFMTNCVEIRAASEWTCARMDVLVEDSFHSLTGEEGRGVASSCEVHVQLYILTVLMPLHPGCITKRPTIALHSIGVCPAPIVRVSSHCGASGGNTEDPASVWGRGGGREIRLWLMQSLE